MSTAGASSGYPASGGSVSLVLPLGKMIAVEGDPD